MAQPQPTRTYGPFSGGTNAVGTQVDTDLNTVYTVLQGGIGNTHIASDAAISGTKIASNSIPSAQILAEAWTTYTPTLGGVTLGNGTITGRYIQYGKNVNFYTYLLLGTTTTVNSDVLLGMPVAAQSLNNNKLVFPALVFKNNGGPYNGATGQQIATNNIIIFLGSAQAGDVKSLIPGGAWASGDYINVSGIYEAA